MEDNKNSLRNRINDLDSLPEGYSPDLDSKWALLEQGLEKNSSFAARFKLYSAAAIILAFLLLQFFSSERSTSKQQTGMTPVKQNNKIVNASELHNISVSSKHPSKEKVKNFSASFKHTSPVIQNTLPIDDEYLQVETGCNDGNENLSYQFDDGKFDAAADSKPIKKRYVNLDFGKADVVANKKETADPVNIRFRIGTAPVSAEASDGPSVNPFSLHQNF